MNFLYIILVIVCIICCVFIITKKKSIKVFYGTDIYPELKNIDRDPIMKEVTQVLEEPKNWTVWPEKDLYANKGEWKIFPLYASLLLYRHTIHNKTQL